MSLADTDTPDNIAHERHVKKKGVAKFEEFENFGETLDMSMRKLVHVIRQVDFSNEVPARAFEACVELHQLLHLFRENASYIYEPIERRVQHPIRRPRRFERQNTFDTWRTLEVESNIILVSDLHAIPERLVEFGNAIRRLLEAMCSIPEFDGEGLDSPILAFCQDLGSWANSLHSFEPDQFKTLAIQRYVHQLTDELSKHFFRLSKAVNFFIEFDVEAIRSTQKALSARYQNLSTVSTFFCAVAATSLQYSTSLNHRKLGNMVNQLWVLALVFSLAATINSQLQYHWRLPSSFWAKPKATQWSAQTSVVFLISAVATYLAGLVCYTFAQFPTTFIPAISTASVSVSLLALLPIWSYVFSRNARAGTSLAIPELHMMEPLELEADHTYLQPDDDQTDAEKGRPDGDIPLEPRTTRPISRFRDIANKVMTMNKVSRAFSIQDAQTVLPAHRRGSLLTAMRALPEFRTIRHLRQEGNRIRHVRFSPDGQTIVSCGDISATLWNVETGNETHELVHDAQETILQLLWSPSGDYLLTRTARKLYLWDPNAGTLRKKIDREVMIHSVSWMPRVNAFVSVEGVQVHIVNLDGKITSSLRIDGGYTVKDVAVTHDEEKLLAVAVGGYPKGTSTRSAGNLTSSVCAIISLAGNTLKRVETSIHGLMHEPKEITLSEDSKYVMINYTRSPTQLFALGRKDKGWCLDFKCNYVLESHERLASPSQFGTCNHEGTKHDVVFGISRTEQTSRQRPNVYMWDRDTGRKMYCQHPHGIDDFSGITFNPSGKFSFATISYADEGHIRVWEAYSGSPLVTPIAQSPSPVPSRP
ncbi:uncharacterized protein EI90DRAFT_3289418 [Cantharellus anzutake]|uniref:uncharacterized protein n=1 Tax=Cantharellus anzutake TaxID=1750568 RepID=UPI001905EE39|nr:uncharacterized protein EI90DRAFT_3289418 [Cantharellus anzutake]KAF8331306.1 hypothetical protein EI90DRAFT_3289418 [Cantharellus anzutake]